MEKYPVDTRFGEWFLTREGKNFAIRRMYQLPNSRKKKSQRLSKKKYFHLTRIREIEDFVVRLNGKNPVIERIKDKIAFKHAWISSDVLRDYKLNFLMLQMPDRKRANTHFYYLNQYVLNFFIEKLGLQNPLDWHRNQDLWGKYLLNRHDDVLEAEKRIFQIGEVKSGKVIQNTVHEVNRFMSYLHLKRPDEVPPLKFRPISKAAFKQHEAWRVLEDRVRLPRYIRAEDYEKICASLEKMETPWRFAVYLAHDFGLRRSECLGLLKSDIRKSHLAIERQYAGIDEVGKPSYKPLKSRRTRRVPYWRSSPSETYYRISNAPTVYPHPDTLSYLFVNLMIELKLPRYTFHDLRRTFITNCVKSGIPQEELRLAVGHLDTRTTYRYYVIDIRDLESDVWTPEQVEPSII